MRNGFPTNSFLTIFVFTFPFVDGQSNNFYSMRNEGYLLTSFVRLRSIGKNTQDQSRTTDPAGVFKCTATIPYSPSFADGSTNSISAPFNPPRISVLNHESDK